MKTSPHMRIEGQMSASFEAVREAFAGNLSQRHDLGGACCVAVPAHTNSVNSELLELHETVIFP